MINFARSCIYVAQSVAYLLQIMGLRFNQKKILAMKQTFPTGLLVTAKNQGLSVTDRSLHVKSLQRENMRNIDLIARSYQCIEDGEMIAGSKLYVRQISKIVPGQSAFIAPIRRQHYLFWTRVGGSCVYRKAECQRSGPTLRVKYNLVQPCLCMVCLH